MLTHSTRRRLAGLGVAGALIAAVATPATPASAEEPDISLGVYFGDNTLAAGSPGKVDSPVLFASSTVVVHDLTVRYDFTDLAGKATVTSESDSSYCSTPEPNVLVCTDPFEVELYEDGFGGLYSVVIAPTKDAKDGDEGTVKVSLSATGYAAVTHEARVRIGEGVDLAAGPEEEHSGKPGSAFTMPLRVGNPGDTVAKGAVAVFYNDYGIQANKQYSNCTYEGSWLRTCHFDRPLERRTSYVTTLSYRIAKDSFAPSRAYGEILWMTPAEFEDFEAYAKARGASFGEPGTGGKLGLDEAGPSIAARSFQADTQPDNNWSSLRVKVTGKNGTDLAAVGDEVSGAKGDEVVATVGFRNNGPATLDYGRSGSSVTHMQVGIPNGTTAVKVPDNCSPVRSENEWGEPGEPGARLYRCYTSWFIKAGDEEIVEFGLRIDKVVPNATGDVKVNVACQCDGGFYADLKPANDTAKLVVNPSGGQGGDGGSGGDGGELPITGANTALIAGVGGVLLAAGVAGFVLARRRRTHFTA
ncbi:LPXTG cell wall anchor domain-containing protein [Verrucosispora sp. WMMA2044]|uniref:LPXTG cell wall anchor domain-containing protein n=1 Tax=Verrucosispora sp. WMMA2044 TaxID=3016419 RepID=UPI00248ACF1E|nr:LPXTG cell wall anchor domain-containing protein [Verrucosispora sp. WMMA2044]WBB48182.1 LPXTG cell wall anchor domain-containing protein [Verrucosispora sp. WMMA2044]